MKENTNIEKKRLLEDLEPEKREWILETATHMARLSDMLEPLASNGIHCSYATLQRFVRRHREGLLLAEGEDMKETVEALAKRGRGESFRKGTLEAVRQRLYEQAMLSSTKEETQKLFGELLKEETKLKELDLAERKQAVLEEGMRLERLRLRMEMREKRKVKAATITIEAAPEKRNLTGGNHRSRGTGRESGEEAAVGEKLLMEGSPGSTGGPKVNEGEKALETLARLREILNRGGRTEEKVLEARAVLAEMEGGG